jgi:para-nitrobenzyl esterase
LSAAEQGAAKFQEALNASNLAALRNVPADRILGAQLANSSIRFGPIIDGQLLPDLPQALFAARKQSDIPLLIGYTRNDLNGMELQTRLWAQAQHASGRAAVFVYTFTRVHPYSPGVTFSDHDPKTVGAYHTADVPYWLGTLESLNLFRRTRDWTDLDRRLSDQMSNAIVRFAKTGNPNEVSRDDWPAYEPDGEKIRELGDVTRTIAWPH